MARPACTTQMSRNVVEWINELTLIKVKIGNDTEPDVGDEEVGTSSSATTVPISLQKYYNIFRKNILLKRSMIWLTGS